jgi:glutaconate CoA-transferase subunit A
MDMPSTKLKPSGRLSAKSILFEDLVKEIPDGCQLAMVYEHDGFHSAAPMDVLRALIRRKARHLRILCVPVNGMTSDILVGAGCVDEIEFGALVIGEHGFPPRILAAATAKTLKLRDTTCPAILNGLLAKKLGVPFLPVAGILGSDLVKIHSEWKVTPNPYSPEELQLLVPAMEPDVALFHAPFADQHGNVWISRRGDILSMAHSARKILVTVDQIVEGDLMEDPALSCGTLSHVYVDGLCERPNGCWPMGRGGSETRDVDHIAEYVRLAATDAGFQEYLDRFVFADAVAEATA